MYRSPEEFLAAWDEDYLRGIWLGPMFVPGVASAWSREQRDHFIRVFFHIRGHFGEVLWALGNAAPDSRCKEIVLDNMRDELGGDRSPHERLYLELARALGCDLKTEYVDQQDHLPFARLYNDLQLRAVATQDWRASIVGFAAGERLDNIDYPALRPIFASFGLSSRHLVFFDAHSHAEHFAGALASRCARSGPSSGHRAGRVRPGPPIPAGDVAGVVGHRVPLRRGRRSRGGGAARARAPEQSRFARPSRASRTPTTIRRGSPPFQQVRRHCRARHGRALAARPRARRRGTAQDRGGAWPLRLGRHVLVFGGNGFVGAHIVHRLLADPRVLRVTAIVRSRPEMSGRERILEMLAQYELPRSAVDLEKLTVADGSMCARRFGLSEKAYDGLARDVDTVFNCAGSTDYVPPYLDLRGRWVLGLLGVIQFCFDQRMKQVVYTGSTIAHLYRDKEDFARPNSWWYSGYAQVKWVNQGILAGLAQAGMRAVTCEAPYILGSTTVGKDPGYVYSFWRGIRLGAVMQLTWDGGFPAFSPVDIFVDAAVTNALGANPLPVVRPISPWPLRMADLAPLLNCRVVSWEEFLAEVRERATPPLMRIIPDDVPQLVEKTNLEPIYPAGYDIGRFPPPRKLAELYLTRLNLLSTSWRAHAVQTEGTS